MTDFIQKKCPKCGQELRFPKNIGGMLMACPTCGQRFYSDFKLAQAKKGGTLRLATTIFEAPSKIVDRIGRYFSS